MVLPLLYSIVLIYIFQRKSEDISEVVQHRIFLKSRHVALKSIKWQTFLHLTPQNWHFTNIKPSIIKHKYIIDQISHQV